MRLTLLARGAGLGAGLLAVLLAASARADEVHLVGGTVIEGKASRVGDKVLVQVAAGTLSLAATAVARIRVAPTALEHLSTQRAALSDDDLDGRLALANRYRAERLFAEEEALLFEIIERAPDHEEARRRLGFVRSQEGWITREAQLLAAGFVRRGDTWVSQGEAAALALAEVSRVEREREAAVLARAAAEREREAKRAEAHATSSQADATAGNPAFWFPWGTPTRGAGEAGYWPTPTSAREGAFRPVHAPSTAPNFGINGVRHPSSYFR